MSQGHEHAMIGMIFRALHTLKNVYGRVGYSGLGNIPSHAQSRDFFVGLLIVRGRKNEIDRMCLFEKLVARTL